MNKSLGLIFVCVLCSESFAQTATWEREPFEEASRAIAELKNRPIIIDSLKKVYEQKWVLSFTFGQRYITRDNLASDPDEVTTADITRNTTCYGLGSGYFLKTNWYLGVEFDFLPIKKVQEFKKLPSNTGVNVKGSGSGGVMLNLGVLTRRYVSIGKYSRTYVGLKSGFIIAGAGGGTGGVNSSKGQYQEVNLIVRAYGYGNLTLGISHRLSPVIIADFNTGYMLTTRSSNIGGIESPGGVTAALSLQFVIGGGKGL